MLKFQYSFNKGLLPNDKIKLVLYIFIELQNAFNTVWNNSLGIAWKIHIKNINITKNMNNNIQ